MDLKEIRKEIDATDDEILRLFLKRMDLCVGVAKYKKENNMQVFQGKREQEILERINLPMIWRRAQVSFSPV